MKAKYSVLRLLKSRIILWVKAIAHYTHVAILIRKVSTLILTITFTKEPQSLYRSVFQKLKALLKIRNYGTSDDKKPYSWGERCVTDLFKENQDNMRKLRQSQRRNGLPEDRSDILHYFMTQFQRQHEKKTSVEISQIVNEIDQLRFDCKQTSLQCKTRMVWTRKTSTKNGKEISSRNQIF